MEFMGLGVLSGCPACAGCLTQVPWAQRSLAGYCGGGGHMQLHPQGWGPWAELPAALPVTHVTGHPSLAPWLGWAPFLGLTGQRPPPRLRFPFCLAPL